MTRVNGNLNLSRAIGDLKYKGNQQLAASEQIITAQPDVRSVELTTEDRFLLLACDGVWDVLNNQQVLLRVPGSPWGLKISQGPQYACTSACAIATVGSVTL